MLLIISILQAGELRHTDVKALAQGQSYQQSGFRVCFLNPHPFLAEAAVARPTALPSALRHTVF